MVEQSTIISSLHIEIIPFLGGLKFCRDTNNLLATNKTAEGWSVHDTINSAYPQVNWSLKTHNGNMTEVFGHELSSDTWAVLLA